MKLTLEQIDAIANPETADVYGEKTPGKVVRMDDLAELCQLARERLTAGTFQQGIEAAAIHAAHCTSYDDIIQKSAGCMTTGQRISQSISNLKQEASNG